MTFCFLVTFLLLVLFILGESFTSDFYLLGKKIAISRAADSGESEP